MLKHITLFQILLFVIHTSYILLIIHIIYRLYASDNNIFNMLLIINIIHIHDTLMIITFITLYTADHGQTDDYMHTYLLLSYLYITDYYIPL